jgi:hypothetical protein
MLMQKTQYRQHLTTRRAASLVADETSAALAKDRRSRHARRNL